MYWSAFQEYFPYAKSSTIPFSLIVRSPPQEGWDFAVRASELGAPARTTRVGSPAVCESFDTLRGNNFPAA